MATISTKRPTFFEGQYLGAQDLTAVVTYFLTHARRQMLGGHTWGIAMGLKLEERETPAGDDEVDVYIQPGYAWDGYGRPIVVLAPYKLPPDKCKNMANGEVKVWLRYKQSTTDAPPPGLETCETAEQYARIQESFDVEAGDFSHSKQHDGLSIAGESVDAMNSLHHLDDSAPLFCDESIPFQIFPEDADNPRWLIPLGSVNWVQGTNGQAGKFIKTEDDKITDSRKARIYIGAVAENLYAADGVIRLRDRGTRMRSGDTFSTTCEQDNWTDEDFLIDEEERVFSVEDLVWVEGNLRAKGDVKLFGTKLDFRGDEGELGPLWIRRSDGSNGNKDLQVVIGEGEESDDANTSFAIGRNTHPDGNTLKTHFSVLGSGNVGIGLDVPEKLLHIKGSEDPTILVELDDTHRGGPSGRLSFRRSAHAGADIYYDDANDVEGLVFGTVDNNASAPVPRVIIKSTGEVGIGNTDPSAYSVHADDLVVKTEENTGITVVSGASGSGRLNFADGTSGIARYRGYLRYSHQSDYLKIGVAGSTKMTLVKEGNVGIGTDRPGDYYSSADDLVVCTEENTGITIVSGSNHQGRLVFADGTEGDEKYRGYLRYSHQLDKLAIGVAGNTKMTLFKEGNVGIGTGSPTEYSSFATTLVVTNEERSGYTGNTGITVVSGPTNQGMLSFSDGAADNEQDRGFLRYNHELERLSIGVAGATRITTLYNGDVGIGTVDPQGRLHIKGSEDEDASHLSAHVAIVENDSTGGSADVLALKIGSTSQGVGNNFITFFAGGDVVGRIEGTDAGVTLESGGADFAERLPRLNHEEDMLSGDIVGLSGGFISHVTSNVENLLVVSHQAVVVGNSCMAEEREHYETVALVGQVPTRVRGPVRAGDYIAPSGFNDGTGVAIPPGAVSLTENVGRIVGRAWESSNDEAIKMINTAVGIHAAVPAECFLSAFREQEVKIRQLEEELEKLRFEVQSKNTKEGNR